MFLTRWAMRVLPDGTPVPILTGPLRGYWWRKAGLYGGYCTGRYECVVTPMFARLVRPGDTVFDVGAHHGFYSVLSASRGARVVAVEPDDWNASQVETNSRRNRCDVAVVRAAVSDAVGEATFHRFDAPSLDTFMGKLAAVPGQANYTPIAGTDRTVPTVTLVALADRHGFPAVVKMDVEGAESLALRGGPRVLAAGPVWMLSTHSPAEEARCGALFAPHGYTIRLVGYGDVWLVYPELGPMRSRVLEALA